MFDNARSASVEQVAHLGRAGSIAAGTDADTEKRSSVRKKEEEERAGH